MKNKQPTIKDIAQTLNLHFTTVSRALRNHPDVSPETKKKVLALARKLNYNPNVIAQSLKKRGTNTLGVIVPEINHNFFASVISGIEDVAYKSGYTIIVSQSNEDYDREKINTKAMLAQRISGLLISIAQNTVKTDHINTVHQQGVPVVAFDRVFDNIPISKVISDDYNGAYRLTNFLIEKGYKRIAYISGPEHLLLCQTRIKGYKEALMNNGFEVDEKYIISCCFDQNSGRKGFQKVLELENKPDAIFSINDHVALGILLQAKKIGLQIPKDLAIVGFSDDPLSSIVEPALTTVAQQPHEIGKRAAKLLIDQIKSTKELFAPRIEKVSTKLIIRNSA